ncbi:DUF5931 domain-containing protein [Glycomyces albus]
MGIETQLRRAITVFRFAALGYPLVMCAILFGVLVRPVPALLLVASIALWTWLVSASYARHGFRTSLLCADLAATVVAVMVSAWALELSDRDAGISVGPWQAGAVLVWAVSGGRRRGVIAAAAISAVGMAFRGGINENTLSEAILLILTGLMVGHLTRLAVEAERRMRQAAARSAAARERERLARDIHDSVLQVLALVQRRGNEVGGEAAELGRLAGQQEEALRALISSESYRHPLDGQRDVRELLGKHSGEAVTIAAPAVPVRLPSRFAHQLAAAVSSALDNVREHCPEGTHTWMLVEDDRNAVTVTVRDNGPGMDPGRLAEAAAEGAWGWPSRSRAESRNWAARSSSSRRRAPGRKWRCGCRAPNRRREAMATLMVVDDHPIWRDAISRDLGEAGHEVLACLGEDGRR